VESVRALRGDGVSADLEELTLALGGSMLELAGAAGSLAEGESSIRRTWASGRGYEKFLELVEAQGGDPRAIEDLDRRGRAKQQIEVVASQSGLFHGLAARPVGEWITEAGGGRLRAGDPIDPNVGVEVLVEPGRAVNAGDPVCRLHHSKQESKRALAERAQTWILLGTELGPKNGRQLAVVDPPSEPQR